MRSVVIVRGLQQKDQEWRERRLVWERDQRQAAEKLRKEEEAKRREIEARRREEERSQARSQPSSKPTKVR